MSFRPHGRAYVDLYVAEAWGICDRCGIKHNMSALATQYEWAGAVLMDKKLLVCTRCLDVPSIFKKTIIMPPDGLPVVDPRPEDRTVEG